MVIGPAPGGVRGVIARGGAAGRAAAIRQAGGVIGPAIRPKAGRARRHRAGAASSGRRGKAAGGAGCFRAGSVQAVQYGAAVCCMLA